MVSNTGRNKGEKHGSNLSGGFKWRENGQSGLDNVWHEIDSELLHDTVHYVTAKGAALILGVTSDGGAYSVCVLDGDSKIREYPHGKVACEDLLRSIKEYYRE